MLQVQVEKCGKKLKPDIMEYMILCSSGLGTQIPHFNWDIFVLKGLSVKVSFILILGAEVDFPKLTSLSH